jgi:hypothetical protein
MSATTPVVDVAAKTVTHAGTTFFMRPLTEDSYTVLVDGIPVGRAVYSFGANAVVEPEGDAAPVAEDVLFAVSEAWFAAIES